MAVRSLISDQPAVSNDTDSDQENRASPRTILVGGGSAYAVGVLLLALCLFTWLNSVIVDASGALRMISAVIVSLVVYCICSDLYHMHVHVHA